MLERFRTLDARLQSAILGAGALVLVLIATQFLMPGSEGGGRGTPGAVLFQGLILGLTYAVFATGVVLVYRAMRIINFAQGPVGAAGVAFGTLLLTYTPVPFPVVVILALGLSMLIGLIIGLFMLRFIRSSRLFLTVATLLITGAVTGPVFAAIQFAPFYPHPDERLTGDALTPERIKALLPFPGLTFEVGALPVQFGFAHIFAIELCIVALVAVAVFLRYTRTGIALRALAENPERASLLGISVGALSVFVWVVAGLLDGVAVISAALAAPSVGSSTAALLPIFAIAVLARFESLPRAWFIALLVGVVAESFYFSFDGSRGLFAAVLFVVVSAGLLAQRRMGATGRSETAEVSWAASNEVRPVPQELARLTPIRVARWAIIAVVLVAVVLVPFIFDTSDTELMSIVFLNAIAVLSLIVLTGWAGQVSLGQYAFVAIGAVVGGALTARAGLPFWVAVPLAGVVTAVIAVIIGVPALRIRGLFLLVSTFAFALAVQALLFDQRYFGWLLPGAVDRPTLFFLDFEEERSMYFLCAAALGIAIMAVNNLRRSRIGRLLIAVRDNENSVAAFGITVLRVKLTAFAISGAMAGCAGAVLAHHQRGITPESFGAEGNLQIFIQAVIGGVGSSLGAILGSAYFVLTNQFLGSNPILAAFVTGLGPLLILFFIPGGLSMAVYQVRDAVLRIVAQRRHIVVPSLFADYDATALERQLVPLGEPDPLSGLAALPIQEPFALESELYQGRGVRIIDRLGPASETADAAAIGAAARAALEAIEAEAQLELEATTAGADRT